MWYKHSEIRKVGVRLLRKVKQCVAAMFRRHADTRQRKQHEASACLYLLPVALILASGFLSLRLNPPAEPARPSALMLPSRLLSACALTFSCIDLEYASKGLGSSFHVAGAEPPAGRQAGSLFAVESWR